MSAIRAVGVAACLFAAAVGAEQPAPIYQPRFADAPPARVGQASRGDAANIRLVVLAPDQKGASATPSPRLGWFQSAASTSPVEIVVQERGADAPLVERRIESAGAAGYHSLDLGEFNVRLKEGREYEWSVALINDPARRASDLFSKGVVQFVPSAEPPPSGAPEAIAREYLARGYWYDAIALMQQTLAADPGRTEMDVLRQQVLAAERLLVSP